MLLAAPDEVYAVLKGAEVEARLEVVDVSSTASRSSTLRAAMPRRPDSEEVDEGESRFWRPRGVNRSLRRVSTGSFTPKRPVTGSRVSSRVSPRPRRLWLVWTSAPTNDQYTVA